MATTEDDRTALAGATQPGSAPSAIDKSKRSVSIRINASDSGRVKTIAQRLQVNDSEVFRYLIHRGLKELAPLFQGNVRGHEILAMLAGCGDDLIDQFNLDADRIGRIINGCGDDNGSTVDEEDAELLSMLALPPRYLAFRLSELTDSNVDAGDVRDVLRRYLDDKYAPVDREINTVSN